MKNSLVFVMALQNTVSSCFSRIRQLTIWNFKFFCPYVLPYPQPRIDLKIVMCIVQERNSPYEGFLLSYLWKVVPHTRSLISRIHSTDNTTVPIWTRHRPIDICSIFIVPILIQILNLSHGTFLAGVTDFYLFIYLFIYLTVQLFEYFRSCDWCLPSVWAKLAP